MKIVSADPPQSAQQAVTALDPISSERKSEHEHVADSKRPLPPLSIDGTDLDSLSSSDAAPGHQLPPGLEVIVQPPTRANTMNNIIEENNRANLFQRLYKPSLSRLRLTSGRASSPSRMLSSPQPRSPPPEITEGIHNDSIFPKTICVIMNLTFVGEKVPEFATDRVEQFQWTESEKYKQLVPDGFMSKLQDAYEELKTQDIYLRYGTCQVKGPSGLEYDSPVSIVKDHEQLSENAIRAICDFISKHPYQHFDLKVYWDYGSAQIKTPTSEQVEKQAYPASYATMIQKEMEKKLQTNFVKLRYIPRRDLDVFLQPSVIENVVKENTSLPLNEESRKQFITNIQSFAPKLFAICVYRGLDMAFLEHLMSEPHCCQDTPDRRPRLNMECNKPYCTKHKIQELVTYLPIFFAEKITRNYQHSDLSYEKVLPLHDVGDDDEMGCATRKFLGTGAFGQVFAVKINLAHNDGDAMQHARSLDLPHEPLVPAAGYESPDRQFAVKEFSDGIAFNQERTILGHLAKYTHPHIVLHLTTWTQNSSYYILYDLARCNLRTYIATVNPPRFTKPHVLWFLRQLDGLARAISHVHHFKRATLADPTPEPSLGRHNDIKPENILVFERAPNENPLFKIADFGQGVFVKSQGEISRKTRHVRGTETYWAPDYDKKKVVSRPFDMWALGCVYLELLLWLFGFFQDNESDNPGFATRRQDFPEHESRGKDDRFWLATGYKEYALKPAVRDVISELKGEYCKEMPAFLAVLKATEELLCVEASERLTADKLTVRMASIVSEATGFLNRHPDFFDSRYRRNIGKSDVSEKPGTEIIEHDVREHSPVSRTPSFENGASRSSSMRRNEISNLTSGSNGHADQQLPGGAGELERELEHISASIRPSEQPAEP